MEETSDTKQVAMEVGGTDDEVIVVIDCSLSNEVQQIVTSTVFAGWDRTLTLGRICAHRSIEVSSIR